MPRYFCGTCNAPKGFLFMVQVGQLPVCPSCKKMVAAMWRVPEVHWAMLCDDGPIFGYGEMRQAVACLPRRVSLTGLHATGDMGMVNCVACRRHPRFIEAWNEWSIMHPNERELWESRQILSSALTV